jgi:hypothetical protein
LFELLRTKRKVALRLGRTKLDQDWTIDSTLTKPMLQFLLKRLQTKDASPQLAEDEQLALDKLITRWHQITEKREAVKLGLRQKGGLLKCSRLIAYKKPAAARCGFFLRFCERKRREYPNFCRLCPLCRRY